jgi:hypothetical protein
VWVARRGGTRREPRELTTAGETQREPDEEYEWRRGRGCIDLLPIGPEDPRGARPA